MRRLLLLALVGCADPTLAPSFDIENGPPPPLSRECPVVYTDTLYVQLPDGTWGRFIEEYHSCVPLPW